MLKKLRHNNIEFLIHVDSDIEQHRYETAFSKEPETIGWIDEVMQDGEVFLDVGANIGIYSLYAAARYPKLKIYSCEPAYHNFYKLCNNTIDNKFTKQIIPLGIGLSNREGCVELHLSSLKDGSASHSIDKSTAQKVAEEHSFSHVVAIMSLDRLIEDQVIYPPQHIKIDVDGVESDVIAGMSEYLRSKSLKSILIELDHKLSDTENIITSIESSGFNRDHPLNTMVGHSRERRSVAGHDHIENIIFTRT